MTDTQPTKFCVGCKWCGGYLAGYPCHNPKQNEQPRSLVTGRSLLVFEPAERVRTEQCKGEWWEEQEPLTFEVTPLTAKRYPVRPSLTQRIITKWKGWWG